MRAPPVLAALAVVLGFAFSLPAAAGVSHFTATLTAFTGNGSGLPSSPIALPATGCAGSACSLATGAFVSYSTTGFSIGSGVFLRDDFVPSATNQSPPGTVPLPTAPNLIYVLGQVINQHSANGSLSVGGGPGGGFGGTLGTGSIVQILIGITPLLHVFGSIVLPINAGVTTTPTVMANVLGFQATVTIDNAGWTTGTITFDDRNVLATTGGTMMSAIPNRFVTSGTAMGSRSLTSLGGQITLVTPIAIQIGAGSLSDLRAGYQVLTIHFFPEPTTALLLVTLVTALLITGRRRSA